MIAPLIAASLIGAGASLGTTAISGGSQNKRGNKAYQQQRQLMDLQFQNQTKLNQQGNEMQREMWQDTNYPAQMKMIKEAGLNPALLYGKGGAGGTTTGSQGGGSASSGSAPAPQQLIMPNMMDITSKVAEIALIQAQKSKTEAETKAIPTNIEKTEAETKNIEANTAYTEVKTEIDKISLSKTPEQLDASIANVKASTEKLKAEGKLTSENTQNIINETATRVIGQTLENELTSAKTRLTETEAQGIRTKIMQEWAKLNIEQNALELKDKEVQINKFAKELEAEYPSAWDVVGNVLNKAWKSLENFGTYVGQPRVETKTVKYK